MLVCNWFKWRTLSTRAVIKFWLPVKLRRNIFGFILFFCKSLKNYNLECLEYSKHWYFSNICYHTAKGIIDGQLVVVLNYKIFSLFIFFLYFCMILVELESNINLCHIGLWLVSRCFMSVVVDISLCTAANDVV